MTIPKMPDRRATVKGLALSALMAAPAAAASPQPDEQLLALREPLERLAALERAAGDEMARTREAANRYEAEHVPAALYVRAGDAELFPEELRKRLDRFAVETMPRKLAYGPWAAGAFRPKLMSYDHALATNRQPRIAPEAAERMREIIAAHERWFDLEEASQAHREADRAEAEHERIAGELNVLVAWASALRATTLAGLQVKCIAAAACSSETVAGWLASPRTIGDGAEDEMASILTDIMAAGVQA